MKHKLLIIDDNAQDIILLKELIDEANLDFDIYSADSAEAGIKSAEEILPDIIMVDTLMPGLGGIELCHKLKKEMKMKSKIIVMTGSLDAVAEEKARDAGADEYCIKLAGVLHALLNVQKKL